jgi:hypothetical protein
MCDVTQASGPDMRRWRAMNDDDEHYVYAMAL